MLPVVAHVIAAEGPHCHGVSSDHADLAGGGCGGLACHDAAYEDTVIPVSGLVDQRSGLCTAAAEDDSGDGNALLALELGADAGAVDGRSSEAGVGVRTL